MALRVQPVAGEKRNRADPRRVVQPLRLDALEAPRPLGSPRAAPRRLPPLGEAGIPGTDPANNYSNNYSNLSAEFGLKILRRIEALRNGLREAGQLRPELSRVATIADDIKASGAHLRSEIQDIQALLDEKLDRVRTLIDQRLDEVVALEARLRNLELRMAGKALPTVRQPGFQEAVAEMRRYCERHGTPPRPFVLAGYPKCGNT